MGGDRRAGERSRAWKVLDWSAKVVLLLISDAKASKEDSTYSTYMTRRERALFAVTSRESPDSVRNYTALLPSFEFSTAAKRVHRFGGGVRETALATAQSLRAARFGTYFEAGRLALSYLSYSGMSALLVVSKFLIGPGSPVLNDEAVSTELERLARALS